MAKKQPEYGKRIVHCLRQLTQFLDTHSRQLLKVQDITFPQLMCLENLKENGSTTVVALSQRLCLSASTTVGIIDRLEKKQFVTRTRSSTDRRSVIVDITRRGMDFLDNTPPPMHNTLHLTVEALSPSDQIHLTQLLEMLVSSIKEGSMPGA